MGTRIEHHFEDDLEFSAHIHDNYTYNVGPEFRSSLALSSESIHLHLSFTPEQLEHLFFEIGSSIEEYKKRGILPEGNEKEESNE